MRKSSHLVAAIHWADHNIGETTSTACCCCGRRFEAKAETAAESWEDLDNQWTRHRLEVRSNHSHP